jgi:hypothetical protein
MNLYLFMFCFAFKSTQKKPSNCSSIKNESQRNFISEEIFWNLNFKRSTFKIFQPGIPDLTYRSGTSGRSVVASVDLVFFDDRFRSELVHQVLHQRLRSQSLLVHLRPESQLGQFLSRNLKIKC